MKTKFGMILGLAVLASTASAHTVDFNLGSDAVRLTYSAPVHVRNSESVQLQNLRVQASYLYVDQEDVNINIVNAGATLTGVLGKTRIGTLTGGVGVRGMFFDADKANGGAIALGGDTEFRFNAMPRAAVGLEAYYSPNILSFNDIDGYIDYTLDARYDVLPNAQVYGGYRQVRFDSGVSGWASIDNGLIAGVRVKF